MNSANSRRQLDAIGRRRARIRAEEAKLAADTKSALANAKKAAVPIKEAAKRVGITRTTAYQVYM
jgi:cytochrome c556